MANELRDAEQDLIELRVMQLEADPSLIPRTYDLTHLCRLHFHLFRDVYEWAGELRTVGIAKGTGDDNDLIPPMNIAMPVAHVADRLVASDRLRAIGRDWQRSTSRRRPSGESGALR